MTSFIPSVVGRDNSPSDRRVDVRKALRANAELLIAGQLVTVRTLDISISGLGVASAINPRPGQSLSLFIAPPSASCGPARLEMPVTVVHSILTRAEGEFKVGLQFGQLSATATEIVRKYLAA